MKYLSAICLVLLVFSLIAGPIDFLVLGALRRRGLTWITFPAVALAVALLVLWLSRAHLGDADSRRALEVVDVGRSGEVLRRNRFELFLPAREGRRVTEHGDPSDSPTHLNALPPRS